MTQTILFYDLETSGLSKSFDQVFEFAAIRTDMALNELERYEVKIKLSPDVVPHPAALITHRIPFEKILTGQSEDVGLAEIHAILNTPGTLSGGYNTLGFDDEFLRFGFYRNLLTPYTHQYANQCGRFDLYPVTLLYALFQPEVLDWPKRDDGQLSLKLEAISEANQLVTDGHAHRAMTDVEATVALAKRLAAKEAMWQYVMGYFDKATEQTRMAKLAGFDDLPGNHPLALYVSGKLGAGQDYQCPVLGLGQHQLYKNQTLWLRIDHSELQQLTPDNLLEGAWVIRKKLAEPGFLLPLAGHYKERLSEERMALATENLHWLAERSELFTALQQAHAQATYPKLEGVDIDAALYQIGFRNRSDEALCREFHMLPLPDRAKVIAKMPDQGMQQQAWRILWRHHGNHLPKAGQAALVDYVTKLQSGEDVIDFRGERRYNHAMALQDIAQIQAEQTLDINQQQILQDLQNYLAQHTVTV